MKCAFCNTEFLSGKPFCIVEYEDQEGIYYPQCEGCFVKGLDEDIEPLEVDY